METDVVTDLGTWPSASSDCDLDLEYVLTLLSPSILVAYYYPAW